MKTTPFLIIIALFSTLFLTSCGGGEVDPNKVYSPKEFHDEYTSGYSMKDFANTDLDGQTIKMEGTIEDVTDIVRNDVTGFEIKFINLEGDKPYAKYGVNVMFIGDEIEKTKSLKEGDKIKFEATINDYINMEKTIFLNDGKLL
ncbi:MAG: hypothetical protein HRT58_06265 [Crocinitomicaceae bacterium]|nr:hypothetical protein [Flavobacteriales bacterium]NQZ35248.1 hypothetical protein [Crocinitomicaceae bacterium]